MKNFFLSLFLFLLSASLTHAQVANYTFNSLSGTYTAIAGGTVVATATATGGAGSLDDVNYVSQTIPFGFLFNGVLYNSYTLNSNGYITFGNTLPPPGSPYTPISSTVGYDGAIASVGRDIQGCFAVTATRTLDSDVLTGVTNFAGVAVGKFITGTGIPGSTTVPTTTIVSFDTGAGTITISANATSAGSATVTIASGEIRSETTGSAGSRVHTIQFKNFRKFAGLTDNFNMQIKLYETSNLIECAYGFFQSNTGNAAPQVGLRGTSNADFNNRTTTTNWSASTAGALNTSSMTLNDLVFPASGQILRWTPFVLLANDVGTTVIVNPVNGGGDGNQAPVATIKNFGSVTQSGYNVICTISPGGYSNTQVAPSLISGATTNINFANVNLAPNVAYTVTVYTNLSNDENRANDTQKVVATLVNANYGQDSGYFYANNLATNRPSFPEWCWKDTTGSTSVLVNGLTAPGNTLVGSVDDGYYKLSLKNILLSFGMDTTDRHLKYNGVCYDSIFPGTNGIIGFTEAFGTYSLSDFNIDGAQVAKNALLPIWHDFDLGTLTLQTTNRLSYLAQGNQLIITYSQVAAFLPEDNWVTFQVAIEIVSGCAAPNSNYRYTFADTTNGQTSAAFLNNYLAQYPAPSGQVTTFRNYISGFSLNGSPIVYGGYVSAVNPFPASPVTQVNIKRPIYNLTTGSGLAIEYGPSNLNLNEISCTKNPPLRVSVALQGLQSNLLAPRVRDTVTINVREAFAPYAILGNYKVLLDSAYNGSYSYGYANLDFAWEQAHPYYLEVLHRNSVFAWSNTFSSNTDSISYDFTTSIGQTYGNNAKLINGAAAMYTGDVVSPVDIQDGCVDLSDIVAVYNESSTFASGPYVLTDLNYDGIVDLSDIVLVFNNANAFVCGIKPPGAANVFVTPSYNKMYDYVPDTRVIILPDPYFADKNQLMEEVKINEQQLMDEVKK